MIYSSTELLNAPVIHTTVSILIFLHKCTICIIRVLQSFSSTYSNCILEKALHYTDAKPQPFDWLYCDKWTQSSVHSSWCIHANFIHTATTKLLVLCQNFPFQIKHMLTYICMSLHSEQKPCSIQEIIIMNYLHVAICIYL